MAPRSTLGLGETALDNGFCKNNVSNAIMGVDQITVFVFLQKIFILR